MELDLPPAAADGTFVLAIVAQNVTTSLTTLLLSLNLNHNQPEPGALAELAFPARNFPTPARTGDFATTLHCPCSHAYRKRFQVSYRVCVFVGSTACSGARLFACVRNACFLGASASHRSRSATLSLPLEINGTWSGVKRTHPGPLESRVVLSIDGEEGNVDYSAYPADAGASSSSGVPFTQTQQHAKTKKDARLSHATAALTTPHCARLHTGWLRRVNWLELATRGGGSRPLSRRHNSRPTSEHDCCGGMYEMTEFHHLVATQYSDAEGLSDLSCHDRSPGRRCHYRHLFFFVFGGSKFGLIVNLDYTTRFVHRWTRRGNWLALHGKKDDNRLRFE